MVNECKHRTDFPVQIIIIQIPSLLNENTTGYFCTVETYWSRLDGTAPIQIRKYLDYLVVVVFCVLGSFVYSTIPNETVLKLITLLIGSNLTLAAVNYRSPHEFLCRLKPFGRESYPQEGTFCLHSRQNKIYKGSDHPDFHSLAFLM